VLYININSLTIIVIERERLLRQKFLDVLTTNYWKLLIRVFLLITNSLVHCVLVGLDYQECVAPRGSTHFVILVDILL
jgi:hypothetical protein